jgi:hypothetical protein
LRYDVRPIDDLEPYREALIDFWREHLGYAVYPPAVLQKRFDWLYRLNPRGRTLTVVAFAGSDIVGCGSLYPWPCVLAGQPAPMWVAIDFAVHPKHRAFGPAFALQKTLVRCLADQAGELAFVYPNRASVGPFKMAGFEHVGTASEWVRIVNVGEDVRHRVGVRVLRGILSSAANAVEQGVRFLQRRTASGYQGSTVARCDERFDALWERHAGSAPMLVEHSAACLNWRFGQHPTRDYRFFTISRQADTASIEGCLIYHIEGQSASIKDVFPATVDAASPLLSAFIDEMAEQAIRRITLSFWGDRTFRALLRRQLFVERPTLREYYALANGQSGRELQAALRSDRVPLFFG